MLARIEKLEKSESKKMMPDKLLYTIKEAAVALNVSTRQIHRYIKRGLLKRSLVDHKVQITAASVKAFVEMAQ